MGYKAYSDGYLMSLTKAQIIELLRVAEHNFFATEEALNNFAKAGMEIAEKFDEAKRLLKAAVEGFNLLGNYLDDNCPINVNCIICPLHRDINCKCWKHKDEALALIGEDGAENDS